MIQNSGWAPSPLARARKSASASLLHSQRARTQAAEPKEGAEARSNAGERALGRARGNEAPFLFPSSNLHSARKRGRNSSHLRLPPHAPARTRDKTHLEGNAATGTKADAREARTLRIATGLKAAREAMVKEGWRLGRQGKGKSCVSSTSLSLLSRPRPRPRPLEPLFFFFFFFSLGARTLQRSRSDITGRLVGEAGNNKRR